MFAERPPQSPPASRKGAATNEPTGARTCSAARSCGGARKAKALSLQLAGARAAAVAAGTPRLALTSSHLALAQQLRPDTDTRRRSTCTAALFALRSRAPPR